MKTSIGIVGAGHVGAETANEILRKNLGNCVLLDIVEGMPQGKGLDLAHGTPIRNSSCFIKGTNDYKDLKGCNPIVITAGVPRKPGMTREDLLRVNLDIIKSIVQEVKKYAGDAILIVVTNPLDAMTYATWKLSGFERNRVMGMAGVLDSTRFRAFLAMELGVSPEDVQAMVLGSHGDLMVPLPRYASVSGIPVTDLLPKETIEKIANRTRNAGTEIVGLLKTGSAYYSPGAASALMVESIVLDSRRVMPVCAYLNGEYGIKGVFAGVPVILGANGIEKILDLPLTDEEKKLLNSSLEHVRKLQAEIDGML